MTRLNCLNIAVCFLCILSLFFCGCRLGFHPQSEQTQVESVTEQTEEAQTIAEAEESADTAGQLAGSKQPNKQTPAPVPVESTVPSADQSYTKTVYGYTVKFTLPGAWVDGCSVEATDEAIRFTHTASKSDGGLLMLFYFNDIGQYDPAFVPLGQIDGYEYGYVTPMDVQFSPDTQAQYEQLSSMIETVAASFTVSGAEGDADMLDEQHASVNGYLVSFVLPENWTDVSYEVFDTSIVFYHEPSKSAGGMLFVFYFNPLGTFDPALEKLGQIDNFEYGYVMPMDVQFPPDQQAAYEDLLSQVPQMANSFYVR